MKLRSYLHGLLIAALLGTAVHTPRACAENTDTAAALIVAGVGIGFIGLMVWLFGGTSDEDVLANAQRAYANAHGYDGTATYLEAIYPHHSGGSREDVLETLAMSGINSHSGADMQACLRRMEDAYNELNKRIREIASKSEKVAMYNTMSQLAIVIAAERERLRFACTYINNHGDYFAARETIQDAATRHGYLINATLQGAGSMRVYVNDYGRRLKVAFPRLHIVEAVAADRENLQRRLSSGYYPRLMASGRQLLGDLDRAQAALQADPDYDADVKERERLKIEREKVDVEREKAEAQERQARAQEEQARQARRANELERERNRIEREKLEVEKAKLRQQATCPFCNQSYYYEPEHCPACCPRCNRRR